MKFFRRFINNIFLNPQSIIFVYGFSKAQHAHVKGEVSQKFDVISKPKNVCLTIETKQLVARFVINYHLSARKLSISASGQGQSRLQWIET